MPLFIVVLLIIACLDHFTALLLKFTLFMTGIGVVIVVVSALLAGAFFGLAGFIDWIATSSEDPESAGTTDDLPSPAEPDPFPVDLNFASRESLVRVPFIGEATARAIIDNRPYDDVRELLHVEGIGPRKLHHFEDLVRV